MFINIQKTSTIKTPAGKLEIGLVNGSYVIKYHNSMFVGSPFTCPVSFSTVFTIEEIVRSPEVRDFLARFTDNGTELAPF